MESEATLHAVVLSENWSQLFCRLRVVESIMQAGFGRGRIQSQAAAYSLRVEG
jgi:hypothetical protein